MFLTALLWQWKLANEHAKSSSVFVKIILDELDVKQSVWWSQVKVYNMGELHVETLFKCVHV